MRIYEAIIARVKELMEEQHLTQNGLAYKSGVPQATVKSMLNGETKNPKVVTIAKLCDGLGISIGDFFGSEIFQNLEQELY